MSTFMSYLGGIVGGFSLIYVPVPGLLSGLDPLLDVVGTLSVVVFAVSLIVHGVRCLVRRA